MKKPVFLWIGTLSIPLMAAFYNPAVGIWCKYIEAHATESDKANPAFINGYYAFGVLFGVLGAFCTILSIASICSIWRQERKSLLSLIYGIPSFAVSVFVITIFILDKIRA